MKLKYLGTAAAEGWPGMFCSCDNCKRAALAGGRNIRTRSQAVVDDKLLIDFPADTYMHVLLHGLDLTKINHCIITHNHSDHLYAADFEFRNKISAHMKSKSMFTVYGTQASGRDSQQVIDTYELEKQGRVTFKTITPFVPFQAGDYTVTALKADHDPASDPVFYIITDGSKTLLYANDTGYFPEVTWNFLAKSGHRFDFVSLDCTLEVLPFNRGHMGLSGNADVKKRLLKINAADQDTVFCINHFSHNGKLIYDELVPVAKKYDFLVSYDGMTIEI